MSETQILTTENGFPNKLSENLLLKGEEQLRV